MEKFKMNKSDGGEVIIARKKAILGLIRPNGVKERDDDLHLFKEIHKREKDRVVSLLQPVSEEFESNGHNSFYGMAHGKFASENGKNDYDWLKTPPATPLFASLEMEAINAPELAVHRELPIIHIPIIKSTGSSAEPVAKVETEISKSPTSKAKGVPRHTTRSSRLSSSSNEKKNIKNAPILNHKITQTYSETTVDTPPKKPSFTRITTKPVVVVDKKKETQMNANMLGSDFNKSMGVDSSTKSSKSRYKSTIPSQVPEYSDETPPNLKTERSCSVSRVRASTTQTPSFTRRLEPIMQTNRVPNSHNSVSRIRKQETTDQNIIGNSQKEKAQQGNKTHVYGSRMVDRVTNARMDERKPAKGKLSTSMNESSDSRRASIEDRQSKINFNTSLNEVSGFGRLMSKSSLDMAMKHMDFKRDSSVTAKNEFTGGRRSISVSVTKRS